MRGGRKRGGGISSGASAAAAAKKPSRGPQPGEEEEEDAVADEEEEEEEEAEAEMGEEEVEEAEEEEEEKEEEAEAEEAEMGEARRRRWGRHGREKSTSEMSFDELHSYYYESKLRQVGKCPNKNCNCLAILSDVGICLSVVMYLCWFNGKTKYKQDTLVFEWFKYTSMKRTKVNWFCLPYIDDGMDVVPEAVRKHMLCLRGLQILLDYGRSRF